MERESGERRKGLSPPTTNNNNKKLRE